MDAILDNYNIQDAFSIGDGTVFDLPEIPVANFLIEQLAWTAERLGYEDICKCNPPASGTGDCGLCDFIPARFGLGHGSVSVT